MTVRAGLFLLWVLLSLLVSLVFVDSLTLMGWTHLGLPLGLLALSLLLRSGFRLLYVRN